MIMPTNGVTGISVLNKVVSAGIAEIAQVPEMGYLGCCQALCHANRMYNS